MRNDLKAYEEIVTQVRPVCVKRYCLCGGEFEYCDSGITLTSYPPKYMHVCDQCGNVMLFDDMFPKIGYEEVDD